MNSRHSLVLASFPGPSPSSTWACSICVNWFFGERRPGQFYHVMRATTYILIGYVFALLHSIITFKSHGMMLNDSRVAHHMIKFPRPSPSEKPPTRNYHVRSMCVWRREKVWV